MIEKVKDLGVIKAKRYGLYRCAACAKLKKVVCTTINRLNKQDKEYKCRHCSGLDNKRAVTHGLSLSPIGIVLQGMRKRCADTANERYGKRGVTVCKEWLDSPEAFFKWAQENGYEKGLQIDKDELSHKLGIEPPIYSPETCQFVTPQRNRIITEELK